MRSPNARMQRLMRICIRDFRFANGFTQEEMAEQLRLLPEDYEALESGKAEFSAVTLAFFLSLLPSDERNAILTHFAKKTAVPQILPTIKSSVEPKIKLQKAVSP